MDECMYVSMHCMSICTYSSLYVDGGCIDPRVPKADFLIRKVRLATICSNQALASRLVRDTPKVSYRTLYHLKDIMRIIIIF